MRARAGDDTRIIVGATSQDYPGWVHTQENQLDITRWNDWTTMFEPGSLTHILSEHVWEHLPIDRGMLAARHCYHMLASGGRVRCAVPDGNFPNEDYQRIVKVGGPGPADHPAASHKVVYTWDTLTDVFASAGFDVTLLEWCDENGDFHATDWDEHDGFVYRSVRFDHRNRNGTLGFVSLIVDAIKPGASNVQSGTVGARRSLPPTR
jgi:predicted SAM-dependent methyltransferase